jgi:large subunit ribosomal protein L22
MEDIKVTAKVKNIKGSARKTRLVANLVKNLSPEEAITTLSFLNYKNAGQLAKVIKTALVNAETAKLEKPYKIEEIRIDEGTTAKRFRFRSRGRVEQINKRNCNILVKIGRI